MSNSIDYDTVRKMGGNIGSAPAKYYVQNLNTPDGSSNNDFFTFTPIGNARTNHISGDFERPIPTRLNPLPNTYSLNYSTTPQLGLASNINPAETDMDLILKTGLTMRPKGAENDLSALKLPHFGDINQAEIGLTSQNAGQYFPGNLQSVFDKYIPGLNAQPNIVSQGTGAVWPLDNQTGVSSRVLQQNIAQGKPSNLRTN